MSDCDTEYILFCEHTILPNWTVYRVPNQEIWIIHDLKTLLNQDRGAKPVQQVSNSEQLSPQPPTFYLPPMFTPYHTIPCCFYPPQWTLQNLSPHLEIAPPVTTCQVRRQLDTLHPFKAPAPNGTSPRLMEGCAHQLSSVLETPLQPKPEAGPGRSSACFTCQRRLLTSTTINQFLWHHKH